MVKVPAYIEVQVVERKYLTGDGSFVRDGNKKPLATRHVLYWVREKEELVTVDFVKPAAGSSKLATTFGTTDDGTPNNQYFKQITNEVKDTTLATVTGVIKQLAGTADGKPLKGASSSFKQPGAEGSVDPVETLIAAESFDVHDCAIESKIQGFLHTYLHDCRKECAPSPFKATFGTPK